MKKESFLEYLRFRINYLRVYACISYDQAKDLLRLKCIRLARWIGFGRSLIKAPDRRSRQAIINREHNRRQQQKRAELYNALSYAGLVAMICAVISWYDYEKDNGFITKEAHDSAKTEFEQAKKQFLLYSRWYKTVNPDADNYILQEDQADRLEKIQLEDYGSTGEWIDFLLEIFDYEEIDSEQ